MTVELVNSHAYRVYTFGGRNETVGLQLLNSDEKICVFDNGLIYVIGRNSSERKFFRSLVEYEKMHFTNIVGYCDLFYTEPFTLATLLMYLAEDPDNYNALEMTCIITMLQELFCRKV